MKTVMFTVLVLCAFMARAQTTVNLGIQDGGASCGACPGSCQDAGVCSGAPTTGSCGSTQAAELNIVIPAGSFAQLSLQSVVCGSSPGLDVGDGIFINGSEVVSGSNDLKVNFSDCYAAPPAADQTLTIRLEANRRNETIDVTYAITADDPGGCSLLPVELLYFTGEVKTEGIELTWATESETDNDYFVVEYSADGRQYEAINRIAGSGQSVDRQDYHLLHRLLLPGPHYYRLRQVDFDGSFELSDIIVVHRKGAPGVRVYPTILIDELHIEFERVPDRATPVILFNLLGVRLGQWQLPSGVSRLRIGLQGLPQGHYFLRLGRDRRAERIRLVKIN